MALQPESAESNGAASPLVFFPNRGQTDPRVVYEARTSGFALGLTGQGAIVSLDRARGPLELRFLNDGAHVRPHAADRGPGSVNLLVGPKARHRSGLPVYRTVVYPDVWPGIDVTFRSRDGSLHYELVVHPGADVADARLNWRGARGVALEPSGAMRVETSGGSIVDSAPRTYQIANGRRVPVASRYSVSGTSFGFEVGRHDAGRTLVIDPQLQYSTFLGGLGHDEASDVAVDREGFAYVTGGTTSPDYPTTDGAFDRSYGQNSAGSGDAFVTKIARDGSRAVYSTFLGGTTDRDGAGAIAVDDAGHAYIAGATSSADFPTTPGAHKETRPHNDNPFVSKLSADGSHLVYSTYLGNGFADASGLAVDSDGHAYVAGDVCCGRAQSFPTTPGVFQPLKRGGQNGWIAELDPHGSDVLWATMFGGLNIDVVKDMAIDPAGSVYVVGETFSDGFPITPDALQPTYQSGGGDGFLIKVSDDGTRLLYSTYLGGPQSDGAWGVAVDGRGSAYVVGETDSRTFPTTPGAFQPAATISMSDAFVTKFESDGSGLAYSTFLGSSGYHDRAESVAVDAQGSAYVSGLTNLWDFPTTPNAFQPQKAGASFVTDGFVTKLSRDGSRLVGSTFIGGHDEDEAHAIAVDRRGVAFVVGKTRSDTFPTTPGAFDRTLSVPSPPPSSCCAVDAFAASISIKPGPPAELSLEPPDSSNPVDTEHCLIAAVKDAFGSSLAGVTVRFAVTGATLTSGAETSGPGGEARFCYSGPALPGGDDISAFADSDGDGVRTQLEPQATATKAWETPPSGTRCKFTGAGRITTASNDTAWFSGNARASVSGPRGNLRYTDRGPATPLSLRSRTVTSVSCAGNRLTVFGQASVGGDDTDFRVDVLDGGQRGDGDRYRIRLASGYDSGEQPLDSGDLRIR